MTQPLLFLAYASSASHMFPQQELIDLLAVSRRNNEAEDISGMLLYRGGNFLQALEGPETAVRKRMDVIQTDHRHRSIILLDERMQDERIFGEWSMGFEDVSGVHREELAGLNDYLSPENDAARTAPRNDHDVFELFRTFRELMR